jgi:hypothetical protein
MEDIDNYIKSVVNEIQGCEGGNRGQARLLMYSQKC